MQNRWDKKQAKQCKTELDLRVYSTRLLGQDQELVLHGGGNTSVKINETNIVGEQETILYVKGSGWDLATIEAAGFSPVRMQHLVALSKLDQLSDPNMVNELKTHMTRASTPTPSVEAILHAILPFTYVDHTHADAVVTVTNTNNGKQRIEEIYADDVVVIPYVMPGFDLAKLCAQIFPQQSHKNTKGMVLMNHGIFSFGETAEESYVRMIELVGRAEDYLHNNDAWTISLPTVKKQSRLRSDYIDLREQVSRALGAPCIIDSRNDEFTLAFAQHPQLQQISQQGPATPDHIIRTKRVPMIGNDVHKYEKEYQKYFSLHNQEGENSKTMLDTAPRLVLDPSRGLSCIGRSAIDAKIGQDIYRHSMSIILRAQQLGGYCALPAEQLFAVEYWDLEQAKLRKAGKPAVFSGEIALITGAASGIGKACVHSYMAKGAAVVALDCNPDIVSMIDDPAYLGIQCDLTHEQQIIQAIDQAIIAFGGIDMAVLNAGLFPGSAALSEMDLEHWHQVQAVNVEANVVVLRELYPSLSKAPNAGRVVIIGSKNVPAPGPGAAAYSASKSALNQIARVAALEWGDVGIRINTLHPNAVFDTQIWSEEILKSRADFYGISVQAYKKKNVLKVEVTSNDVANLAAALCEDLFAKTTGAQIPVDGGNERVI